jgi:cyclophilin family peptidyl-prolyl cis-trans isomerase
VTVRRGLRRVTGAFAVAAIVVAGCSDDGTDATQAPESVAAESGTDIADCPPDEGAAEQTRTFDEAPPDCLEAGVGYQAVVETNVGEFTIELEPESAPIATNNFVFLARNLYFDDTECHRIIPDFVVQCGDPTATGTGGPGYTIADEPPEPGRYQLGSIAMARTPEPDSAGSQFFIVTGPAGTALPPEYALFGQVVDGYDTTVSAMAAAGTPGQGVPSETIEIRSVRIVET